jgi:hypothetical protein
MQRHFSNRAEARAEATAAKARAGRKPCTKSDLAPRFARCGTFRSVELASPRGDRPAHLQGEGGSKS